MDLKRNIFYLYDNTRILFNEYYNGHKDTFTNKELENIKMIINKIEEIKKDLTINIIEEYTKNDIPLF